MIPSGPIEAGNRLMSMSFRWRISKWGEEDRLVTADGAAMSRRRKVPVSVVKHRAQGAAAHRHIIELSFELQGVGHRTR